MAAINPMSVVIFFIDKLNRPHSVRTGRIIVSVFKVPCVSTLLQSDFLGEIHMTTSEAVVSSNPASPLFWVDVTKDDPRSFRGVWLDIGRFLCIVVEPPRKLTSAASIRLWSCLAAPALILAAAIDISIAQPAKQLLLLVLRFAGRLTIGLLGLLIPRPARWWGETRGTTPAARGGASED